MVADMSVKLNACGHNTSAARLHGGLGAPAGTRPKGLTKRNRRRRKRGESPEVFWYWRLHEASGVLEPVGACDYYCGTVYRNDYMVRYWILSYWYWC